MVERIEREALVEYQLAVQAILAGAHGVTPVTVDEVREGLDEWLESPLHRAPVVEDDRTRLHRMLGVA